MPSSFTYFLSACLFIGTFIFPSEVFSQEEKEAGMDTVKERSGIILIGAGFTATSFYGDLNYHPGGILSSDFLSFYPGLNLTLRADGVRRIFPMLNLGIAQFVAQNPELAPVPYETAGPDPQVIHIQPNTFVRTLLVYGEVGLHVNLIRRFARFRPYASASVGVLSFTPEDESGTPLVRKKSTRSPAESSFEAITLTLPLSLGVDFRVSSFMSLDLSYTFRIIGTDYLDNIADLGQMKGNDQLHVIKFGMNFRVR